MSEALPYTRIARALSRGDTAALAVQQLTEPVLPFVRSVGDPEVLERDCQLERELQVGVGGPIERSAHVVPLGEDDRDLEGLILVLRQVRVSSDRNMRSALSPAARVSILRLRETLGRERANRLEHPVTLLAEPACAAAEKALVEQRGKRVEIGVAHGLRGLERASRREDGKALEELPLVRLEQVV